MKNKIHGKHPNHFSAKHILSSCSAKMNDESSLVVFGQE